MRQLNVAGAHLSRLARCWSRTPPAPLAAELAALSAAGRAPLDLVTANPHEQDLVFPPELLDAAVNAALAATAVYRPDPLGMPAARQAVAAYYRRRGVAVDPARVVLAPGTSQAYFYALRLLADPGQEVLVSSPGYPLFDDLCAVADVGLRQYHLAHEDGRWRPDVDEIAFQCTSRTRAVMVVSPHNPTGAMFSAADYAALADLCRRRGLALVVDEVFCECLDPEAGPFVRPDPAAFPLLLTLGGVSKMLSLPGWKLGWMTVDGDADRVVPFLRAVEHLSDTFLPMPDLSQAMLPALLEAGEASVIAELAAAYDRRRRAALTALGEAGFAADRCPAGVYLCVGLPGAVRPGRDDEAFARRALHEAGVHVHPGYYYSLPAHWVMTCVAREPLLREGIERLRRFRV
jgi:aspartate/methionine/tyrosine aminotransferase